MMLDILQRQGRWLLQKTRAGTPELFAGLLLVMGSTVLGVNSIVRGLPVNAIMVLCVTGMLGAWWLASSPLCAWASWLILILIGALTQALWVGHLLGPLTYGLHLSAVALFQGINAQADWSAASSAWQAAGVETAQFLGGLAEWTGNLLAGKAAAHTIPAHFAWGLALWAVAAWAAWAVRRLSRPLTGALPAGVLLAGGLNYTGGNVWPLLGFIMAVLWLMALSSWNERERAWQAAQVDIATDLHADVGVAAIGVSITAVVLAWLLAYAPLPHLGTLARQFNLRQAAEERHIAESLGLTSLPTEGGATLGTLFGPLPRSHLIGSGPELSSQLLFTVKIGGQAPQTLDPLTEETRQRYYWRSLVFDQYTGSGWTSSALVTRSFAGGDWVTGQGESLAQEIPSNFRVVRQLVQPVSGSRGVALLYTAGTLLTADREYEVSWRTQPTSGQLSGYLESADAYGASIEGLPYNALSLLPEVSQEQLRQSSGEVPAWIQERYLRLPEKTPPRVLALAQELTKNQPSAYDKAKAIETTLRGFPYTLDLPAPPGERDLVDYFLFDLKRGYCDYYATAMVVLARAAGLPARLVIGYASGTYDEVSSRYLVTAADAHSWPEIYFPEVGWVEFEPTAGQPALHRPLTLRLTTQQPLSPLAPLQPLHKVPSPAYLAASLLLTMTFGILAWLATDRWRLRSISPRMAVEAIFRRLYRSGRRLGVPGSRGETPNQFTSALQARLQALAYSKANWVISPLLGEGIKTLNELYNETMYSQRPVGENEREQAIHLWKKIGWRLWLAQLGKRLARLGFPQKVYPKDREVHSR
jgi:transglutaminase-like putative cysteine protease